MISENKSQKPKLKYEKIWPNIIIAKSKQNHTWNYLSCNKFFEFKVKFGLRVYS